MSAASGGPATINGVIYQMLRSLLQTTRLSISAQVGGGDDGPIDQATLVLEPLGGGGDLRIEGATRIVEQVKSRSSGRPWSLDEVIGGVLPDLYLAVDLDRSDTIYRFVTEGRLGAWKPVMDFFNSLGGRSISGGDVLASLGRRTTLKVGAAKRSESEIFEAVVAAICKRPGIASRREALQVVHAKVWLLLGRFEIVTEASAENLQREIDAALLEFVDVRDEVPRIRDSLLMGLARRARLGGAEVDPAAFLRVYGLGPHPLSSRTGLNALARLRLERRLHLDGYRPGLDVRGHKVRAIARGWTAETPTLVLGGESGQGKSWLLGGLARELAQGDGCVVLIDSRGSAAADLDLAADEIWRAVAGHENVLPLRAISARRREVDPDRPGPWLTVLIDRVESLDEARDLAREDWSAWGVRLVMACGASVATALARDARRDCQAVAVGDFTSEELHDYLRRRLGGGWSDVRGDLLVGLRRPIMAKLFCDAPDLRTRNEFQVLETFWHRLTERGELDADLLGQLAIRLLDGEAYPWSGSTIHKLIGDVKWVDRVGLAGWLRRRDDGLFELWHDRLLSWALAKSLAEEVRRWEEDGSRVRRFLETLGASGYRVAGRHLDDARMDLLWSLNVSDDQASRAADVLAWLRRPSFDLRRELAHRRTPALGAKLLPALFARLATVVDLEDPIPAHEIAGAISDVATPEVAVRAVRLLDEASPRLRRAGVVLLGRRPTPAALDRLWALHGGMQAAPGPYIRRHEDENVLYRETMAALRACVRADRAWLERTIDGADAAADPVHDLAWLLAGIEDGSEAWGRCKATLKRKVAPSHADSLVANVDRHRDAAEADWLRELIRRGEDSDAALALRALLHIAPDAALADFHRLADDELYLKRNWCLAEFLAGRPAETRGLLRERMLARPDPWVVALAFQGMEDDLDPPLLELLLDELETILGRESPVDGHRPGSTHYFHLLAKIRRRELLETIRRRAGGPLERHLTSRLLVESPPDADGLKLLEKMGRSGLARVANRLLDADDYITRHRGLELAVKHPDAGTIERLSRLASPDPCGGGDWSEQQDALQALVLLERWREVIQVLVPGRKELWRVVAGESHLSRPLDDLTMAPALAALDGDGPPQPGAILALGVGGRVDRADQVRAALKQAAVDSDLARAAILAMELLADGSAESVDLLAGHMVGPRNREAARRCLLDHGGEAGLGAVLAHVRSEFCPFAASELLEIAGTAAEAAEMIQAQISGLDRRGRMDLLQKLIGRDDLGRSIAPCLADPALLDEIRAKAYWENGRESAAILALGTFDAASAFEASRRLFRSTNRPDRGWHAHLMVELDPDAAMAEFSNVAQNERRPSVLRAIGRAAARSGRDAEVEAWLRSDDPSRRTAACLMAGWLPATPRLIDLLRRSSVEPDRRLAQAAREALRRIDDSQEVASIVEALSAASEPGERFRLIDELFALGDPGGRDEPWPAWAATTCDSFPQPWSTYFAQRLGQSRGKSSAREFLLDSTRVPEQP